MSGIFGIFRFDDTSLQPELLLSMGEAIGYYGPDGTSQWHEGVVGLGHLLLKVTPEDACERQPLSNGHQTLVTFARLNNRSDLFRELGITSRDALVVPDSALVMAAYQRWGDASPDHLDGDWQFAAWDHREQSLFIARDHFGTSGLYYFRNSKFFAFASSPKALLALPEVPRRPDMVKVAQVLTAWQGEGWRTGYEGVHRLPPGHLMRVDRLGVKISKYWAPEDFPAVRYSDDREYLDHFIELYTDAVRARLRCAREVGICLSGGLDSGSVLALAAPMLATKSKKLTAFTSVPLYFPTEGVKRTVDEWDEAAAVAKRWKNVIHLPVRSPDSSVIAAIRHQLWVHDEPAHAASNHYWIEDIHKLAAEHNIGVLLVGQFGNFTVSSNGGSCLLDRRGGEGVVQGLRRAFNREGNLRLFLKREVVKPLVGPYISFYREHIQGNGLPWYNYSVIKSEFAYKIGLRHKMKEGRHDPTFTVRGRDLDFFSTILSASIGARWHETGASFGLQVRDPTADKRIIEFCFSIPADQFKRKNQSRWLIRRAMKEKLPASVVNNSLRGLQAADLPFRVRARSQELIDILKELERSELASEVLDIARMHEVLSRTMASNNERAQFECNCLLLRGVGVGLFLSGF